MIKRKRNKSTYCISLSSDLAEELKLRGLPLSTTLDDLLRTYLNLNVEEHQTTLAKLDEDISTKTAELIDLKLAKHTIEKKKAEDKKEYEQQLLTGDILIADE